MTSVVVTTRRGTRRFSYDEVAVGCGSGSAGGWRAVIARASQQILPQGLHACSIVRSVGSPKVFPHRLSRRGDDRPGVGRTAGDAGTGQNSRPFDALARRTEAPGKRGFAELLA